MSAEDGQTGLEMTTNVESSDQDRDAERLAGGGQSESLKVEKWPQVFNPEEECLGSPCGGSRDEVLQQLVEENSEDNMRHRAARVAVLAMTGLLSLAFLWFMVRHSIYNPQHIQLIQMYGIVQAVIHSVTICQFFIVWFEAYRSTDQDLFRIHTINSTPKGTTSHVQCRKHTHMYVHGQAGCACRFRTELCCTRTTRSRASLR